MKHIHTILVCLPIFTLPFLAPDFSLREKAETKRFHTAQETATFLAMAMDTSLPTGYNALFAGSGVCQKCHGFDTLGVASVDQLGMDVNVTDDWRATMMANAAKDPFWRAKISHEVLLYPQHKNGIEDKCTSCHAPMGHFNAKHLGQTHYLMADLAADPLGQDGISCLGCHLQAEEGLGFSFSGLLNYDTFKVAYGPYTSPLASPMLTESGYRPRFSPHIEDAGQCAGCHTLITETLDFEGAPTGDKFVEQATYHEWLNSAYNDTETCQKCHMPGLGKDPVFLVTGSETEPRSPFDQHEFVGGNVTMLKLLKDNIGPLGLKASASQFDEAIGKTENMLKNRTLDLELNFLFRDADHAAFQVKLTNKAGHKFPSGYPSRRAFIEFLLENEAGDTLFISGKTDGQYELLGQNPGYEPHYPEISTEDEVQIYELVMGDVNGNVTTVLERAKEPIKDNRIPPKGFTTGHFAYDTCRIAGAALQDVDFNRENGTEGSGSDAVSYYIPVNGYAGHLRASAKVFYQSAPPKWMKEMFDHSTHEIETFRAMFDAADRRPVLMNEASVEVPATVGTGQASPVRSFVKVFPSPTADGQLFVQSSQPHELRVFDPKGNLVETLTGKSGDYQLSLKGKGIFLLRFSARNGQVETKKVVVR